MINAICLCGRISLTIRKNKKNAGIIGLEIGYSIDVGGGFYHTVKVNPTSDEDEFFFVCTNIFD